METIWRQDCDGITYEYAKSPDSCTVRARVIAYNTIMGEVYDMSPEPSFMELMANAMDQASTKLKALREML